MVDAKKLIEQWRRDFEGESYVGRVRVQDALISMWGEVGEGATEVIERWLSVTPHRNLFSADELRQMLDEVDASLAGASAGAPS